MKTTKNKMFNFISEHISKGDIYASKAIAKVAMFLYKYRKNLKMSQKDFARMMGVTQGMVSKWESAEYNFTIENIAQIAEKLNVVFEIELTPENEYQLNTGNFGYEDAVKNAYSVSLKNAYDFGNAA